MEGCLSLLVGRERPQGFAPYPVRIGVFFIGMLVSDRLVVAMRVHSWSVTDRLLLILVIAFQATPYIILAAWAMSALHKRRGYLP